MNVIYQQLYVLFVYGFFHFLNYVWDYYKSHKKALIGLHSI